MYAAPDPLLALFAYFVLAMIWILVLSPILVMLISIGVFLKFKNQNKKIAMVGAFFAFISGLSFLIGAYPSIVDAPAEHFPILCDIHVLNPTSYLFDFLQYNSFNVNDRQIHCFMAAAHATKDKSVCYIVGNPDPDRCVYAAEDNSS